MPKDKKNLICKHLKINSVPRSPKLQYIQWFQAFMSEDLVFPAFASVDWWVDHSSRLKFQVVSLFLIKIRISLRTHRVFLSLYQKVTILYQLIIIRRKLHPVHLFREVRLQCKLKNLEIYRACTLEDILLKSSPLKLEGNQWTLNNSDL